MKFDTNWQAPPSQPTITPSTIHVWRHRFEQQMPPSVSLSADENVRAKRLLNPLKQQQFISTRCALRCLLGSYLQIPPELISFTYNKNGKPALAPEHESSLSFNLSHSGDWAVFAITTGSEVGIDIEFVDTELDFMQIANSYFSVSEQEELKNSLPEKKRSKFYHLWTQKESNLKLQGTGFSVDFSKAKKTPASNTTTFNVAVDHVATIASNMVAKPITFYDFIY